MLRVFKELWTSEAPQFDGEFYRFSNIGFAPKPVQKPHPPLWIGGNSPGAFRRVVTLGDGWHATSQSPEQLRYSLERLQQAAEQAGRPLDTLTLSLRLPLPADAVQGSRQAIIDQYCAYKALGLTHLVVDFRRDNLAQMLDILDLMVTQFARQYRRAKVALRFLPSACWPSRLRLPVLEALPQDLFIE